MLPEVGHDSRTREIFTRRAAPDEFIEHTHAPAMPGAKAFGRLGRRKRKDTR